LVTLCQYFKQTNPIKHMLKKLLLVLLTFSTIETFAQVTTSSIVGSVSDEKGEGLPGATVTATHVPSGTKYGTTTRVDGRYALLNARVGGPYKIEVTSVGYQTEVIDGLFLKLGQRSIQDFGMKVSSTALDEVVIKANDIISGTRTGASTSIGGERLRSLPTISRSTADYTRLNPTSAEGGSFAGRNDQFNNYSLDGAIFNNPFGLDASTPGGQTDANPVSLDAIEEISVQLAPYDVTLSGFTGASINAVTKSGTNNIEGTAYGFTRNQNLVGRKIKDVTFEKLSLSQNQFGFALGGPIIKNKLFFFLNAESDTRSDIGSPFVPAGGGASGSNVSRVLGSDLQKISDLLKSTYGYETGPFQDFELATESRKAIAKLDWNINNNHKLAFTYTYLDASKEKPANPSAIGRRGPDFLTLQFRNSGYKINNIINGGTLELKSQFGNRAANRLQVGLTNFNDSRDPFSAAFPVLNIGKDGVRYIVAGHEPFSINNRLDQRVLQITDNFNIYAGNHTLTFGGSLEKFDFDNSFNLTGYGARVFFPDVDINAAEALIKSADFGKEVQGAKDAFAANKWALAETNLGQAGIYAQDEWSVNNKLNLTYGVRVDIPLYFDTAEKIKENIDASRNCCYDPKIEYFDEFGKSTKFDHTVLPKQTPLISPRVGFNYDIKGDKTQQLRGGSGLFTGRFPFVWIGNQVANPNFFFYCVTDPNFKFPQVWRNNLGYDVKMDNGWIASADFIYTKDIHSTMVRNYGLKLPTGKLQGADSRPIYQASDRATVFGGATNAYVFSNSNLGYSTNATLQLEKSFDNGMYVKFGYNFLDAQDVASIDAEISSDAYDRNPANVQHTNRPVLAPSLYGNRHRLMAVASKKVSYGKMATTFSLFGEMAQGSRFSYTYAGDLNNDGSGLNDLIFIPTDAQIDQMAFSGTNASAQRTALKQYIANDSYLNANRGMYAEKYASLAPWYSNVDLRILQDFKLANKNTIQLSMDVQNVGNLLNKNWGVRQWAGETGLAQPIAVSVANNVPTYTFDVNQKSAIQNRFDIASRWRMQFGLRYIFK
jgi:hypothetical protein